MFIITSRLPIEYDQGDPRNLPEGVLISVPRVRREEISVVNPAPAEGFSQCRHSHLAHVPQPHHRPDVRPTG